MTNKTLILKLVIIGCIFLQPIWLYAQQYNFTTYTESNGLPSGYVEQVMEDSKGYLWICTFGGLSRFDGRNFKNYDIKDGLAGNFCDEICEDKKGNLWICTRKGISCFNGINFTNYYNPDTLASTYTSHPRVSATNEFTFVLNGKNAYIKNGKIELDNSLDAYKELPSTKFTVAILNDGTQIINSSNGLYTLSSAKKIIKLTDAVDNVNKIFVHPSEKNAFYFFNKLGVFHWQNGEIKKLSNHNFSNTVTTGLFVDNNKKIWLGCEDQGVWVLYDNKIELLKNELPGLLVPSFYQDKSGAMWVCTFRGLVKLTPNYVQHFSKANGVANEDIRSATVLIDSNVIMQTTIFANNKLLKLPTPIQHLATNFYKDFVSTIFLDERKKWWIFAGNNIYRYEGNSIKNITTNLKPYACRNAIYCKKDSSIWYAYNNIIYVVKNDKIIKTITTLANGKLLTAVVNFYADFWGNIWIAEKERLVLYTAKGLVDFTPNLHLPTKTVAQVSCSNKDGFWVRTQGFGAMHFSYTPTGFIKDKFINSDNGLPNNFVHDIEVDNKSNIWIATLNGLYRFTENTNGSNNFSIKYFTKPEGIDVANWNLAFLEKDNYNNIWLGVANGVFKINTNEIVENATPPKIELEKITILHSNENLPVIVNNAQSLVLSSTQNDIAFFFNGINIQSAFMQYRYKLIDKDKDWTNNNSNAQVTYYNLAPGKYTFMLKAINDAGLESDVLSYSFIIVPPFWQTWWFRIIVALVSVLLIYWYIKRREKLKENENKIALQMSELKLTALQSQMNPHFIFNSLNSIQNYILQQKPIDAARYLSKFSKLMRRILDQSFNNFTPLNDIVETLKMYLELEAFRFSNEFNWQIKLDDEESISHVKLPPMLLQPFVENAIIHGLMPKTGNKNLLIHLYKANNELHCLIDDDGIGRKNNSNIDIGHISRGQKLTADMLATMKQLLHSNAQIKITDKIDNNNIAMGTTIDLIIPLNP